MKYHCLATTKRKKTLKRGKSYLTFLYIISPISWTKRFQSFNNAYSTLPVLYHNYRGRRKNKGWKMCWTWRQWLVDFNRMQCRVQLSTSSSTALCRHKSNTVCVHTSKTKRKRCTQRSGYNTIGFQCSLHNKLINGPHELMIDWNCEKNSTSTTDDTI